MTTGRLMLASEANTVVEAALLLESGEIDLYPDYLRALCGLIARTFPIIEMDTGDRAAQVEREIRTVLKEAKKYDGAELHAFAEGVVCAVREWL